MPDERPVAMIFDEIAQYAIAKGQVPIANKLYYVKLDDHWEFVVNGFNETKKTKPIGPSGCKIDLPAFSCYIEFNGCPAGIVSPFDGCFAAGAAANEDVFIEALRAARRP